MTSNTLGLVLAGGLARRMGGGDKPRTKIGGVTILQRVLARLTAASLVPEPQEAVPTGAQIAARRYERNLSQRDLAAAAGVSRGLVAEIERGRRTHWVSRWRLAEKLGMMAAASVGGGS